MTKTKTTKTKICFASLTQERQELRHWNRLVLILVSQCQRQRQKRQRFALRVLRRKGKNRDIEIDWCWSWCHNDKDKDKHWHCKSYTGKARIETLKYIGIGPGVTMRMTEAKTNTETNTMTKTQSLTQGRQGLRRWSRLESVLVSHFEGSVDPHRVEAPENRALMIYLKNSSVKIWKHLYKRYRVSQKNVP